MKLFWITYFFTSLIISGCNSQNNDESKYLQKEVQKQKLDLKIPKGINTESPKDSNTLTAIIFNSDSIYCFWEYKIKDGNFYSISKQNSFRTFIIAASKKLGTKLSVVLKPTNNSSYKSTVDALDEMTISKIRKYSMAQLTGAEETYLRIENFSWEPPEPVAITTPESVTSQALPENNAIIIELRKDQSVWYTILATEFDALPHQLKKPITQNLKLVIADLEKKLPGIRKDYLIKGDRNATYPTFEKVIEALKQNNIYKYNLVTSEQ